MPRYCDIVMKGGITSGVVYPLAAVKLAERYRFVNIGGTSAGAIAAAAVAAAEHGKRTGDGQGYEGIALLPDWLGKNMTSLFQPTRRSRPIFAALLSGMSGGKVAKLLAAPDAFWISALVGLLPGLGLIAAAWLLDAETLLRWLVTAAGALVALVGMVAGIVISAAWRLRGLPRSYYGLCPGNDREGDSADPPLTRWLADLLDRLAGKEPGEPLTFGDLARLEGGPEPGRGITLEMITTCLTQGRPYKLPFDGKRFWFDPEEFRDLFPERIVAWMESHAEDSDGEHGAPHLKRLPRAEDLPVVVAARMSLSFPLLIGAVPLYAINYSRRNVPDTPERCWFSDGGITSNFPIHFFDSPVPRWPTFAIDLMPFPPDQAPSADECENVWLPSTNLGGTRERWSGWEGKRPLFGQLPAFLASIFRTAQNWMDNSQMRVAGYRDRIAHVHLTEREGGMNLTMPEEAIDRLARRGACAAEILADRFSLDPPADVKLTWENQRWVRYRNYMRLLEDDSRRLRRGYLDQREGERTMSELNEREPLRSPPGYPWRTVAQRSFAVDTTGALLSLVEAWEGADEHFADGAPTPSPELRIVPRL